MVCFGNLGGWEKWEEDGGCVEVELGVVELVLEVFFWGVVDVLYVVIDMLDMYIFVVVIGVDWNIVNSGIKIVELKIGVLRVVCWKYFFCLVYVDWVRIKIEL